MKSNEMKSSVCCDMRGIHNFRDGQCHLYSSCSVMQWHMIGLAYWESVYKISHNWMDVVIFLRSSF
jgi:hypothetical protein